MKELDKAKVGMVLNHPFFATLLLKHKFEEDPSIGTMATNGKQMKYNPDFIKTLEQDHLIAVLAHECMHVSLCHHVRRGKREPMIWNMATDFVINLILQDSNISLPEGCLLDEKYRDMTAEQVYKVLLKEAKEMGGGQGEGKCGPQC